MEPPRRSSKLAGPVDKGVVMERAAQNMASVLAVGDDKGTAPAEDLHKILRLEGAADVNAELAEIGLSNKSGWYASIVLYGVGGLVTVLAGLLRPQVVPAGVLYLGIASLVFAALAALGARFLTNADWATHVRLLAGMAIFLIGAVVAGDLRTAFLMLPLFVLITPTFLYGARFAIPYVTVITPMVVVVALATPGSARVAHAVVSGGAVVMIVLSFMAAEHRTRWLARANRRLAYTDALTGIANTRRLRETLAMALGRPFGDGQPFALFAIDLDNFKLVNDTFDHTTGDAVLRAVAAALESEVAADDLVARRGGDEFSVLVARPQDVDLARLTTRLANAIERARMATCPQVTPSGSVAHVLSLENDSISSVLQRADDELHATKLAFHAEHPDREELRRMIADDPAVTTIKPRVADREAALRSVSAAVSHVYGNPGARRTHPGLSDLGERAATFLRGVDLVWAYMAVTCLPIGVVLLLLTATGALSPQPPAAGLLLVALGAVSIQAGRRGASKRWFPLMFLGALGSVSLAVAFAGAAGTALIDAYVVIALFGFYIMRTPQALVNLLASCILYVGFAISQGYPDAGIRSAISVSVMLVAAAIVVKVRGVTLRFVRKNRELSEVDPLTGVANLRALRLRVQSAVERGQHHPAAERPVLMTIDLDRFKLVNDVHNHTTGDQMLEAVARAISECVRINEMVARRGGDEFFVLFDKVSPDHLEAVILRVREAVRHARERICPDLTPTASIGYVQWKPGWSADDFLAEADAIMHDEKIESRARDYAEIEVA
jgi:diguanylate cyclase (GGDEF)-like protein